MANSNLKEAKAAKNDEFYTQFHDIEIEMNAYLEYDPDVFRGKTILLPCDDPEWSNFTRFFAAKFDELGLKKLISTSYAPDSKKYKTPYQPSLFEQEAPQFDSAKTSVKGKIFVLEQDKSGDGRINIDDLEWEYLDGDGDFRSKEVTELRDEADFIITNPPFSLFREFLAWIIAGGKRFAVIGNMNAITYKEVFPLIKSNQIWLGATGNGNDMVFGVPEGAKVDDKDKQKAARLGYVGNYTRLGNSCWFTSIEHGRRHQALRLMSMADNLRFSKHKEIRGKAAYDHYDNYDAIEVPFTDAIPSDYDGVMGVPISFLIKYCPEQFEILGATESEGKGFSNNLWNSNSNVAQPLINGERKFKRIFIKNNVHDPQYGIE
ncbi:MAG: adenine-specific methyltransferase EcoRI family protein [Candidatus Bacteroides intestinipullorum]|uniref:Adenine-specific methyltransferase EcoRI family protein n=1 Tax=Candidatus Bacteroides intestinipullorum TaxID=2838471 RepID=A0A9E2KFT3_9BACE|nr:adenine-specific methyltransferase EcoRI family protein [Candidatus Bacteroides intestinipullorum]